MNISHRVSIWPTDDLDGIDKSITLPHPMVFLIRVALLCTAATLIFSEPVAASVVFQPGKKAKYVPPGEEQVSDTALKLYNTAQSAEKAGNVKKAISAYAEIVKYHSKDALAPSALYRGAQLQEQQHSYFAAADSYRLLVERYPGNPHFEEAIEAQFRIGEMFLGGKKKKILGIVAYGNTLERAVTIFANIVRTAPYGKYTARAQFNIGLAREKQSVPEMAIEAYQAVVNKFPNEPVAADAQYQVGYIWLMAARKGTTDAAATTNAKTAFQDFLVHYPHSEKAPQARANLALLEHTQTNSSYEVAKFYDKQKYYRAAVIYYNEVIRQQPGSNESNLAKKRIDQLRAKVGEAALQPAIPASQASKKKGDAHEARTAGTGSAAKPGEANNEAPLPASDVNGSLPPPASLAPDVTTAPSTTAPDITTAPDHLFPTSGASTSSNGSSGPAASASPAP
jgi:outer membrane protein assembly factor BamD